MERLITQRTSDALSDIARGSKGGTKYPLVSVPVGPSPGRGGRIRMLFIGQAGREGCDPGTTFIDAEKQSIENAIYHLEAPGQSHFWQAVHKTSESVLRCTGGQDELHDLSPMVGWSNLAKVAFADKNPNGELLSAQAEICRKSLAEEIKKMRPHATVLLTGDYARNEILYPTFGPDGWVNNVKDGDRVALKRHPTFGLILWGYHPSRKEALFNAEVCNFIGGYIAGAVAHDGGGSAQAPGSECGKD